MGGIHFLGVGHSFIKYPKTVLNLDYSKHEGADYPPLKSRTSDGLEVVLEISFQYKLNYESLYDLFLLYKDNYSAIFSNIAIAALTENVSLFYLHYNNKLLKRQLNTQHTTSSSISRKSGQKCRRP